MTFNISSDETKHFSLHQLQLNEIDLIQKKYKWNNASEKFFKKKSKGFLLQWNILFLEALKHVSFSCVK